MEPLPTMEIIQDQQKKRRLRRIIERVKSVRVNRLASQTGRLFRPGRFQSARLQQQPASPNRQPSGRSSRLLQPRKTLKKIWQSRRKKRKSRKAKETELRLGKVKEGSEPSPKSPVSEEGLIVPMGDSVDKDRVLVQNDGDVEDDEEAFEEGDFVDPGFQRSMDMYLEDAYSAPGKVFHKWKYWVVMLTLGLAYSSEASAQTSISFLLANTSFENNILLNSAWRGGMLASSSLVGQLVGSLCGALSDVTGRRSMLLFSTALTAVTIFASALSQNIWGLSFLRILGGIGIGATSPPLLALASELCPPSKRGFLLTILTSFWSFGSIYVALTAWGIFAGNNQHAGSPAWRWYLAVCGIPSTIAGILVYFTVVESPRFLCLQQRQEEALCAILRLGHQLGYEGPPLTLEEVFYYYPQGEKMIDEDDVAPSKGISSKLSYLWYYLRVAKAIIVDFFGSASKLYKRNMLRRTLPMQVLWIGLYFGSTGVTTWINKLFEVVHLDNFFFNALLFSLAQFPGTFVSAVLIDRMPRQVLLGLAFLLSAGSLGLFAFFAGQSDGSSRQAGIVVSACLFAATMQIVWSTTSVATAEWFPTTVRAMAWGLCSSSAKIGGITGNTVDAYLVSKPVLLLLTSGLSMALAGAMPFILPGGMTNASLQDDVDDDDQDVPILGDDTFRGDNMEEEGATESTPAIQQQPGASYESI